ncbi:CsbD family protein [Roseovarius sp. C7]|uniref:CsbD family protein n=1 Tax=Roseovarius sp. C7 TaxID=3398643 RepID=UPI0039F65BCD
MNWDQVKGNWTQITGQAREQWGKLTDNDLHEAAGEREQLIGKLQEKYGMAKEQAEREVDDFASRM